MSPDLDTDLGPFDLDAYLRRVGLPARVTLDAEGLNRLQRAHRLAIAFENLDVLLGRGVRIDSASVFDKLVTRRRGGYCFEHGRLFGDALAALGFAERPLLARVRLGLADGAPAAPLTHTLSLVTLPDGTGWIADPGFGGAYTPPMPLADGAQAVAPDGARFDLRREGAAWVLRRDGHPGSTDGRPGADQYLFTTTEVEPADLLVANHWTSTSPDSRFTQAPLAGIVLPAGYASLTGRRYRRRAGAEETAGEITDARVYRMRLSLLVGIDLSAEDAARLFARA